MDDIFGAENFRNEIVWSYRTGGVSKRWFVRKHDIIFCYGKSAQDQITQRAPPLKTKFNPMKEKSYLTHKYGFSTIKIEEDEGGYYRMAQIRDVWEIPALRGNHPEEWRGYPTQKPRALLRRIIEASTNEGDVVLDPFCGCGPVIVEAHSLGWRFFGVDLSLYTVQKVVKEWLEEIGRFPDSDCGHP